MNHNILGKIIDKVALDKWKNKVMKIRQQYHDIFVYYDKYQEGLFTKSSEGFCDECGGFDPTICYNYRVLNGDYEYVNYYVKGIYHQDIIKCLECGVNNAIIYSATGCIYYDYIDV